LSGFRLRAFHPLWSDFPFASSNLSTATLGSYNPGGKPSGLDCSAFARHYLRNRIRFLFLVLLRCFTSDGIACPLLCIRSGTIQYDLYQVTPFGNPRVNASLRLSEAYRSLPRPSSPASAKAFTMCPLHLASLLIHFRRTNLGSVRKMFHNDALSLFYFYRLNCSITCSL
jgi:hypothetical protein